MKKFNKVQGREFAKFKDEQEFEKHIINRIKKLNNGFYHPRVFDAIYTDLVKELEANDYMFDLNRIDAILELVIKKETKN